jgi:hypothetical protein
VPVYAAPAPVAPPVDSSGFFGGPAPQPAPSSFGAPPSHFGTPGAQFGGPPTTAYGAPTWSSAPPKKSSSGTVIRVVVGLVVFLVIGGGGLRIYDGLNKHHLGELPESLNGATRIIDASVDDQTARAQADLVSYHVTHFRLGGYNSAGYKVVAEIGEIPAGWNRQKDAFIRGLNAGAGTTLTPVAAGPKGGTVSCGAIVGGTVCAWVDDGTLGVIITNDPAPQAAESYLQALRSAAEH